MTSGSVVPFNGEDCERKIQEKLEQGEKNYLQTLEAVRLEQRQRLAEVEQNYYNQTEESLITSKPPLPTASKRSSSPDFVRERRRRPQYSKSMNIVRRHDEEIAFCPHRTMVNDRTRTIRDFSTEHVERKIRSIWKEFGLDHYTEEQRKRNGGTSASWAGRITVPEPFQFTDTTDFHNVHRRKCFTEIESERLKKQLEEELALHKQFRANPVPAHVHIPLYERLVEEEKSRREQVFQSTKNYLSSISKPFGFDARERAKVLLRRHSFSAGDLVQTERQFKAKPLPNFYHHKDAQHDKMREEELFRTVKKKSRARELLQQSRVPFTSPQSKRIRRSMSVNDLVNLPLNEFPFKPKTNGYYIPNFEKLHTKFLQQAEEKKRRRSPTRCQPFLLYTNLIPSKKEKILRDIQNEAELRHSQSFQIKGKARPPRSAPITSVSISSERSEAIPTKTNEAQRLRETISKKKRDAETSKVRSQETLQRSKSTQERRVREELRQRVKFDEQTVVQKAQRNQKAREMRQAMRANEEAYAKKLEDIQRNLQTRPLLAEADSKKKTLEKIQKKIEEAMSIAQVSEQDLIRHQNGS